MAAAKWTFRAQDAKKLSVKELAQLLETVYQEGKEAALHPRKPKADGYWVPPARKDVSDFEDLIERLVEVHFGLDYESSCPVRVKLLDRTRYETQHWFSIPLDFTDDEQHPYHRSRWAEDQHTPEQNTARQRAIREMKALRIRYINANLSTATKAVEQLHNQLERQITDEDKAEGKRVESRIKTLTQLKEKFADVIKFYRDSGYEVDEVARTYTHTSKWREPGKKTVRPIPDPPADFDALMEELALLAKWKYPEPLPWAEVRRISY